MSRFLPLQVTDIRRETRDAVVLTLQPQETDRERFKFIPGQYLTFRHHFDGQELRRSYSICCPPDGDKLQVGIKRVEGGVFSNWANAELQIGEMLDAMPPSGNFHIPEAPQGEARHYVGFAGGSGITPVISIIASTLAREPQAHFTLIYANRQISSMMFREDIEDLKSRYLGRFSVIHILDSEGQDIDLFSGTLTAEKCADLFRLWLPLKGVHTAFICGPEPMMLTIAQSLQDHGLPKERIKFELFASSHPGSKPRPQKAAASSATAGTCQATVMLDGTSRSFTMARGGEENLLDAALANHMDAPYSCKAGVCSTCRCRVLEGEVEMRINHALEDYEVEQGYVLSCQAIPLSERVVFSFDESMTIEKDESATDDEAMNVEEYLAQGGVLTSPTNVPERYRGELMRLMSAFVDSELAASVGFADSINHAPSIAERITASRITLEKSDHAARVLTVMQSFGTDIKRYQKQYDWAARVPRDTALSALSAQRSSADMRLPVFHYPLTGWIDAVVMSVLQGLAAAVQFQELTRISYSPLQEVFAGIAPREARHTELGLQGLAQIAADEADRQQALQSLAYWQPRIAAPFMNASSDRYDTLRRFGLRHQSNAQLLKQWQKRVQEQLLPLNLSVS